MKHVCLLMTVVVAALSILPASPADAGTNGIMEGTVRDKKSGEMIPAASVVLTGLQRGTSTDLEGRFELQNIRAGQYDLRVSHIGYRPLLLKGIIINPDLRTRLAITLEQMDVELEEVTVIQEKPLIQTDITGTTYIVSGEEIKALPVNNVFDVVGFKAGTTLEGNIRGGKTSEVVYLVDGLPVQNLMQGGSSMSLPKSSVLGMSIYTGGFEPEYGNALSGVVNIITRTGGTDHAILVRADKDNLFGGTQVSKTTQFEGSASGPIVPDQLYYVAVLSGSVSSTRWWQDFKAFFPGPVERKFSGIAKLDGLLSPTLRLGIQMLFADNRWRDYEFSWRYNLDGLPSEVRTSTRVALTLSHSLSDKLFYTASLSRSTTGNEIGEGGKERVSIDDPYQYDFYLRYIVAGREALWARTSQETYTGKFDGTLKAGQTQLLKFGAEMNVYNLNADIAKFEPKRTYFGKPLVGEPQLDFSSTYSYGPRSGALYVQDKVDLLDEGIMMNFGVRYDVLDPRAQRPAIEATLQGDTAYVFKPGQVVPARVKQQISPRFGFAMQLAEHGYLFVNLGWYVQYPLFDYMYTGIDRVSLEKGISAISGNPDLEPERSKLWEFSFKYSLPQNLVLSVTYFKKETSNQIDSKTFIAGDSKVAGNLGFAEYVNTPFAVSEGVELVLVRERGEWLTGEFSYTYMTAEGTSGSASDGYYIAQYGLPPGVRQFPLSWDQRHTLKTISTLSTPWELNLSAVMQWHTGRPYTRYPTSTGFEPVVAGRFYQNNDRMPAFFNLDLKLEKNFRFDAWAGAVATLYLDVRNVTNDRNVVWVDSNGRIGGELGDPSGFVIGRRTSLGFQVAF